MRTGRRNLYESHDGRWYLRSRSERNAWRHHTTSAQSSFTVRKSRKQPSDSKLGQSEIFKSTFVQWSPCESYHGKGMVVDVVTSHPFLSATKHLARLGRYRKVEDRSTIPACWPPSLLISRVIDTPPQLPTVSIAWSHFTQEPLIGSCGCQRIVSTESRQSELQLNLARCSTQLRRWSCVSVVCSRTSTQYGQFFGERPNRSSSRRGHTTSRRLPS